MVRRLLIALMVVAAFAPMPALAAQTWLPLVPCGGHLAGGAEQPKCTPCYIFQASKNVTDLILYGITGPVAAFMFVLAGGMFLVGADNPAMQQRARKLMTSTAYGVGIVLLSWVGTNFLIKNVAQGDASNSWNEFTCPSYLEAISAPTDTVSGVPALRVVQPPQKPYDVDPKTIDAGKAQQLASTHNNALVPYGNSADLVRLIDCLYRDPVIAAMAMPKPNLTGNAKQNGIYTYENDNPLCNYTRGDPTLLGSTGCQHEVNSCHYGGKKGRGAMAVDMNSRSSSITLMIPAVPGGPPVEDHASEEKLFCAIVRMAQTACKGMAKLVNWEPSNKTTHTHVSVVSCDADGEGVQGKNGVDIPNCTSDPNAPAPAPAPHAL